MANYSFDYGDTHFFCLDSNRCIDPNDRHSLSVFDIDGGRLTMVQIDEAGEEIDRIVVTKLDDRATAAQDGVDDEPEVSAQSLTGQQAHAVNRGFIR